MTKQNKRDHPKCGENKLELNKFVEKIIDFRLIYLMTGNNQRNMHID